SLLITVPVPPRLSPLSLPDALPILPGCMGSIHIRFSRLGITSVLPASCGTQKLCATSADSSLRKVGRRLLDSLTGTCISFADVRSQEHTSQLQSLTNLVSRLLLQHK